MGDSLSYLDNLFVSYNLRPFNSYEFSFHWICQFRFFNCIHYLPYFLVPTGLFRVNVASQNLKKYISYKKLTEKDKHMTMIT